MATSMVTQSSAPPPAIQSPAKDVRSLIMSDAFQSQIKKAMPEAMSSDVLLRVAVTTIQKTPKLLECSRDSLMQCVLECAQMGLLPDGILGQAYMVPYAKVATLQIGYRGILELARRSNQVKYVVGEAVYDCDQFKIRYAPERTILHVPDEDNEERGLREEGKYLPKGFRGAYGLVRYKDDTIDFEYLPLHKIERIRSMSQAGSKADGPWLQHFEEMAKKTGIRALGKRLPLSADDLRRIVADEYRESGLDIGYNVDARVGEIAEDSEVEELMEELGWNSAQKIMAKNNHAGRRPELLAYLRSKLAEAEQAKGTTSKAAKESVAADPTKDSTETDSTLTQGKRDQTSSAASSSSGDSSKATGTTVEASTSQASKPAAAKEEW